MGRSAAGGGTETAAIFGWLYRVIYSSVFFYTRECPFLNKIHGEILGVKGHDVYNESSNISGKNNIYLPG